MSRGKFFLDDLFEGVGGLVTGVGKGVGTLFEGVGSGVSTLVGGAGTLTKDNNHEMTLTSKNIVDCINDHGWSIVSELGFDDVNALYLLNNDTVIVINRYINDDNLKDIRLLQNSEVLSTDYMIEVYNPLVCKGHFFTLVESIDITLQKYVYERIDLNLIDRKEMIGYIYEDLLSIFTYLQEIEYSYVNKSISNFAYRDKQLILMNPHALIGVPETSSPGEITKTILYEVIAIFNNNNALLDYLDDISGF